MFWLLMVFFGCRDFFCNGYLNCNCVFRVWNWGVYVFCLVCYGGFIYVIENVVQNICCKKLVVVIMFDCIF